MPLLPMRSLTRSKVWPRLGVDVVSGSRPDPPDERYVIGTQRRGSSTRCAAVSRLGDDPQRGAESLGVVAISGGLEHAA